MCNILAALGELWLVSSVPREKHQDTIIIIIIIIII
jgi:hypothetical protein